MLGARIMVVVEHHPGSPDERWRLEGAADIFYEYVYIWDQEQCICLTCSAICAP